MKLVKCIGIVAIVIAIPFVFNLLFCGEHSSTFFFVRSSISVSDWFAFWVAYFSVIISSFLAYAAIRLSKTIEIDHELRDADNNKQFFCVKGVRIVSDYVHDDELNLEFLLSPKIYAFEPVSVLRANIVFENGVTINCFCDSEIKGERFKLMVCDEDKEQCKKYLKTWVRRKQTMTIGFETIRVNIVFSYELKAFAFNLTSSKRICVTETTCNVKAPSKDNKDGEISDYIATTYITKNWKRNK